MTKGKCLYSYSSFPKNFHVGIKTIPPVSPPASECQVVLTFNLTGLVWLVSKTSKNHKINVKKYKVTSYQKKVNRCQKISTSKKVTKYDPKSASISGPCRTVWNGSSVIFSCALGRFGTVQVSFLPVPSNGLERFKRHRTISNYFAFGLFLPSNGLERFKCTVKASRKNTWFYFLKSVLTVLS